MPPRFEVFSVWQAISKITLPLSRLIRKSVKFEWDSHCESSFQELKARLTTAPVLTIPDPRLGFTIYSDASKQGLGYVLMQDVKDYDCTINYHPGKANVVADALSRKGKGELTCMITQQRQLIHEFARMQLEVVESPPKLPVLGGIRAMRMWPTLRDRIWRDQAFDEFIRSMGAKIHAGGVEGFYRGTDGALEYKGRIVVPNVEALKKKILTEAHSAPYLAHPGSTKRIARRLRVCREVTDLKGMKRDVAEFVEKCLICQQVKAERKVPPGLLQPLEIPQWM
ncbi:retrotransposon protein [Striga asiatica]|uniref:Retrotransposon protein n=1 Tax=Striga asiatica TaxID=4170 RepID=A0A5A7QA55_STRAF|nr:retrotransposon protein [Striga asiatica]